MLEIDLAIHPPRRRTCRVRSGVGALRALVEDLAAEPPGRLLVLISDDNVAPLHAEPLLKRLRRRGLRAELLVFPHGEGHKTRATKRRLEDRLLELGAGRDTALVAVGGGVTGDLAGFVAATWHRGVPVVQVPTSLLAMVDAAVGGKTAVNLPAGKNLVGSFHQPWGVYADVSVLSTLPDTHYKDGFSEVVKSACVGDRELFAWLESATAPLLGRDRRALERAITACISVKARVVARDEREAGRRAVLNFGHTVGHALEAATRYRLSHGRAVAVGLCVEGRLAVGLTGFPRSHAERLEALLAGFGMPTSLPPRVSPDRVLRATHRDKKARFGEVRCSLPRRIGRMLPAPEFTLAVEESALRAALVRPD